MDKSASKKPRSSPLSPSPPANVPTTVPKSALIKFVVPSFLISVSQKTASSAKKLDH